MAAAAEIVGQDAVAIAGGNVEQRAVGGHEEINRVDCALTQIDWRKLGVADLHGAKSRGRGRWIGKGCRRNRCDLRREVLERATGFEYEKVGAIRQHAE